MPSWRGERGTRHERGYGYQWTKKRMLTLKRDQGWCQPCRRAGRDTLAKEVDHIIPKSKGGNDRLSNLQAICRDCHAEKTAREGVEASNTKPEIGEDGWPINPS